MITGKLSIYNSYNPKLHVIFYFFLTSYHRRECKEKVKEFLGKSVDLEGKPHGSRKQLVIMSLDDTT